MQHILEDSEEHIDFPETQRKLVGKVGEQNHLQSRMGGVSGSTERPSSRGRPAVTRDALANANDSHYIGRMISCICHRISDRDMTCAVREGCASFDELQDPTRVATACGACQDCAHQAFHTPARWRSADLLGGATRVEIDHAGAIYQLRLTAQGKLILTK